VRSGLRSFGCAALILALASLASARSATLNASARLRRGPAATTDLVAELPPGTKLTIVAERGGWRQVETPDGKTGFVWAENLTEDDATGAPSAEARPESPKPETPRPPAGASSMADDVRALREDVQALRARPEPAAAADLERLRAEVDRLAQTQRELVQHIEDRTPTAGGDPAPDSALTFVPGLLLIGGALGWLGSRLTAGRRDRRQRNRLRL
jgi:uncharacterized protein YgiM (DUF1202 family)